MRPHQKVPFFLGFLALVFLLIHSISSPAATVTAVKDKRVLVSLDGEPAVPGDIFFLVDPAGKRKGIIKIMKVQGNRAIAVLGKGAAEKGFTLKYRPKTGTATAKGKTPPRGSPQAAPTASGTPGNTMYWGVVGGFAQNAMDVELLDNAGAKRGSASLSGSGYSLKGLFDYGLFDSIWFRGLAGIEQFNVSGPASCGDNAPYTEACNAEIMYLSLDMWGRYLFSQGSFRPWVGGGFSLMFPLTKSATALDESSITNTSVMSFGLGLDWFTSPTFFVPLSFEYGLLPSSDTVSANTMAIRVGAGFSF